MVRLESIAVSNLFKSAKLGSRARRTILCGCSMGSLRAFRTQFCRILSKTSPGGELFPPNYGMLSERPPFASLGFTDLPLREAIDYVHTYLSVTAKAMKFRYGPPICGGPIEVAYISTDRNLRWARHKRFDSAITEHERTILP